MEHKAPSMFIKIKDSAEKKQVYQSLINGKNEIIVKTTNSGEEVFSCTAKHLIRNKLTCHLDHKLPNNVRPNELIIQFSSGLEKYFSQAPCEVNGDDLIIEIDSDLFQLHRREDFRLRLPPSFKGYFELEKLNSEETKEQLHLLDLSGGGCRFEAPTKNIEFNVGDELEGKVQLAKRDGIAVSAVVKHLAAHPANDLLVLVGVQFKNVSKISKNRLVGVVMDVYRELFLRM